MAGKVTTFYSFKGGNGRSMSLANVAWALATNGEKVLVIDWDLEAPGLHRYFHPFLEDPDQTRSSGLVDHIWNYVEKRTRGSTTPSDIEALASAESIIQPLELPLRKRTGHLHFIGAGRQDDEYSAKVGGLDWSTFYARFGGEAFLDAMLKWARSRYTHILIDSRTGVADTAGVCTTQLPDQVALFLVYNRQSIEGTAAVARSIMKGRRERGQPSVDLFVCPSRVEERGNIDAARRYTLARLAPAIQRPRPVLLSELKRNEIRHYPWCAFEEKLAVFEDEPDERGSLLDAMHIMAARLADRPNIEPIKIPAETIELYWRRAAFDDPRLADLEELASAPATEAVSKLVPWLESALDHPEERLDWLAQLAETCVERAAMIAETANSDVAAFLSDGGLELGLRVYDREGRSFRTRFAQMLGSRSDFLQQIGRLDEALDAANQSAALFGRDQTPLGRWRQVRALERVAELQDAQGQFDEALSTYREMVEGFESLGRRDLPIGGELEGLRARRLLASALVNRGQLQEAFAVLDFAVRHFPAHDKEFRARNSPEIAALLSMQVEVAMALDKGLGDRVLKQARLRLEAVSEYRGARASLQRSLVLAEATGLLRSGDPGAALVALDTLDEEGRRSSAALETLAAIHLDLKQPETAQVYLQQALTRYPALPPAHVIDLIRRTIEQTGDPRLLMELILSSNRANRHGVVANAEIRALMEGVMAAVSSERRKGLEVLVKLMSDSHDRPHPAGS